MQQLEQQNWLMNKMNVCSCVPELCVFPLCPYAGLCHWFRNSQKQPAGEWDHLTCPLLPHYQSQRGLCDLRWWWWRTWCYRKMMPHAWLYLQSKACRGLKTLTPPPLPPMVHSALNPLKACLPPQEGRADFMVFVAPFKPSNCQWTVWFTYTASVFVSLCKNAV